MAGFLVALALLGEDAGAAPPGKASLADVSERGKRPARSSVSAGVGLGSFEIKGRF